MHIKLPSKKHALRQATNFIFFGFLFLLLFNPNAKAWILRQLMSVGLFKAEIRTEAPAKNLPESPTDFLFRDEKGNIISTADLKGKVVFINFWATWCPPCRAEMPALNDLYNQFRDDSRFVFLFINEDNDPGKATAYLKRNELIIPLSARAGSVPTEIYSGTLPTTLVLNKDGRIVYRNEGLAKYNTKAFIHQLRSLQ